MDTTERIFQFVVGCAILIVGVPAVLIDGTIQSAGVTASNTLTLSGNSSCGELVNVTNAAGFRTTLQLNITGVAQSYCAAPVGVYKTVQITEFQNTSTNTATQIYTAMNANGSINATMAATNPSAGKVVLKYSTAGIAGNGILTTETLSNGAWVSGALTGGIDPIPVVSSIFILVLFPLMLLFGSMYLIWEAVKGK